MHKMATLKMGLGTLFGLMGEHEAAHGYIASYKLCLM
jgi:hypothetical protein